MVAVSDGADDFGSFGEIPLCQTGVQGDLGILAVHSGDEDSVGAGQAVLAEIDARGDGRPVRAWCEGGAWRRKTQADGKAEWQK